MTKQNKPLKEDWREKLIRRFPYIKADVGDFIWNDLENFVKLEKEKSLDEGQSRTKSQIVEQILGMECMKKEWNDKEMENEKFNYRRRIGYRDQLRLQIKEEINKL